MLLNQERKTNGFRELTPEELEAVSGGTEGTPIIVQRTRPQPWWMISIPGEDLLGEQGDAWVGGPDFSSGNGGLGSGGGTGPDPDKRESEHNCEKTAVDQSLANIRSAIAFDKFNDNSKRQTEYGNSIAEKDGVFTVGQTLQGDSYSSSSTPSTLIVPPSGHSYSDIVAIVHSHPPSGNSTTDAENIRPSAGDWEAADKLTGNYPGFSLPSYADGSKLTLYIQDKDGNVRAFEYKTPAERGAAPGEPGNQKNASGTPVDSNANDCPSAGA